MIHKGIEITNTRNNPVATDICKKEFTIIQQRMLGQVVCLQYSTLSESCKIDMLDN